MVDKPKWARILVMTAGSSMVAMSLTDPPQWAQMVMSIAKTRVSSWAQVRRVRGGGEGASSVAAI